MSLSPPRGPGLPLNALRAFEAAARLGGFAAAAEELCVTPGAVAQQVKSLEAMIGAPLFHRLAHGVELTERGAAAAADLSEAFDRLGAAAAALRAGAGPRTVRIVALPAIAQLWLSPRLPGLRKAAPDVIISVSATERAPHMLRESADLAIFFDEAEGAAERVDLGPDVIFPVCAPSVARRLRRPADLAREVLLTDAAWPDDWRLWSAAAEGAPARPPRGPVFSLYSLAVETAESGGGVLMGHAQLLRQRLKSGRLIAPFAERVSTGRRLTISLTSRAAQNPAAARVASILAAG